jgi:hypothetical protein
VQTFHRQATHDRLNTMLRDCLGLNMHLHSADLHFISSLCVLAVTWSYITNTVAVPCSGKISLISCKNYLAGARSRGTRVWACWGWVGGGVTSGYFHC